MRETRCLKILGIAIYFQTSSFKRTARIFSELHPVSYNAVRRWIKKIEERLPIATEKKHRKLVELGETVVKANKKCYFVYSAIERNELILMKVYPTRNWLVTRSFIKEVPKYCENKPKFVIDKAPWLIDALKSLNLKFEHEGFREKKLS